MLKSNTFFILLISIAFLFSACNGSDKSQSGSTVVEGTIQNPADGKIYFYTYIDSASLYLDNKSLIDSSAVDNKGHYSFTLPNNSPVIFNLQMGSNILANNLFLIPGAHLEINFTGKDNTPEINSSGHDSFYNKFLLQFLDSFFRDSSVRNEYYIASNYMDIHQFTEYIEKRKQKQLNFFNDYFKGDSLNNYFKNYCLNTINYGIASDKLYYLWKKRMKVENIRGDSSFFSFETKSFIENADALNCPAYIRFLNLYIKDTYERMVERGELPINRANKLIPQVEKYKLAVRLLERPYRDVVLYNLIHSEMNEIGNETSKYEAPTNSLDFMINWFCKKYAISDL